MPIVDTSWLVAVFHDGDPHHDEAAKSGRDASEIRMPASVMEEFLRVVFYRVRRSQGNTEAHLVTRRARRDLAALPALQLVHGYDERLAAAIHDRHPKLSYVDAVAIASAVRSRDELLTFDGDQNTAFQLEAKR